MHRGQCTMDDLLFLFLLAAILGFGAAIIREFVIVRRTGLRIKFLLAFTLWVATELLLVLVWLKTFHPDRRRSTLPSYAMNRPRVLRFLRIGWSC